jgi:1,4-dihydroxy-2-naphthoate octaprenyltransferase
VGRERARVLYALLLLGAFATAPLAWWTGNLKAWLLLPLAALPLTVPLIRTVRTRTDGPSLNATLARTGMLQLVFCLLLSAGVLAS